MLGHADGICSVYVDKEADIEKAVKITIDSKVSLYNAKMEKKNRGAYKLRRQITLQHVTLLKRY